MSKKSEQNKKSISDLPTELLFELFSNYLDFNSKLEAEKVCKQWQQIMRMSFDSKRCLIISDYDLHESRLKSLILSNRKISVVKMVSSLTERSEIKDKKSISMVLKKHSNLKTLCICLKYTFENIEYLDLISESCSSSLMNSRMEMSGYPFGGYPFGGYPFGGYPFGGYPFGGYPFGGYPFGGYPFGGYPFGGYPFGGYPFGGYPFGGYPFGGYPFGGYPFGGYPFGGYPFGGYPFGGYPFGGYPFGGYPFGGYPFGGYPFGGYPFGGYPFGGYPFGGYPFGGYPFGGYPLVWNTIRIISREKTLQMAQKISNLKYFYIDFDILRIHEQSLKTMLKEWRNIETIIFHTPCFLGSVRDSENMSIEFSGDYFSEMSPSLVKLELPGNILTLEAIQRIPAKNNLKRLNVSKTSLNSIDIICQKFPELSYFGFTIENSINEDDLYHLMETVGKLLQLEQLYIAIGSGVSINYNCIKSLQPCLHLNTLKIDKILVDKSGIDAITRFFPNLLNLELSWNYLTDSDVVNLRKLNNLKSLNIRGQSNISDGSIANIISNCGQLESIDIRETKADEITLKVLTEKSNKSDKTTEVFVWGTVISELLGSEFNRYLFCEHLLLINEEYDHKIHF